MNGCESGQRVDLGHALQAREERWLRTAIAKKRPIASSSATSSSSYAFSDVFAR